jgi:single-strand DNA-binding protein
MNCVSLVGNLATDVDVREVGEDRKVASFVLAVPRPGDDAGAEFLRISVWNRQGETCARYLTKGNRVAVQGRVRTYSREEEGKRKTSVEIVATCVDFMSPPPAAKGTPFEPAAAS